MALYLINGQMIVRARNGDHALEIVGEERGQCFRLEEAGEYGIITQEGVVTEAQLNEAAEAEVRRAESEHDVSTLDTPRGTREVMDPVTREVRAESKDD